MILLTGATGFLGSKLKESLNLNPGNSCLVSSRLLEDYTNCDLTSFEETLSLSKKINPEIIIHCAASVPKDSQDYEETKFNQTSFLINKNIERCFKSKMIFTSSMTVYNNSVSYERAFNEKETDLSKLNGYAKVKLESENLFRSSKNLDVISLRLPGLFSEARKHGLVHNIVKALIDNKKLEFKKRLPVWSTMHVEDAVRVIKYFTENFSKISHKTINVGYPGKQSIPRMAKLISKIFDKKFYNKDLDIREFEMDLEILNKYFNFEEKILEKRISNLVEFLKENIDER